MKAISAGMFRELRKTASKIVIAWKLTRVDGVVLGFTSYDVPFLYQGVTYNPSNAFSGTAAVAKTNLSVDNMSAVVLTSDEITEEDLRGGKWDNADVKVFWINPSNVSLGHVPIRGGRIGEIKLKAGSFETELRSLATFLQQQYARYYSLSCGNKLGDGRDLVTGELSGKSGCLFQLKPPLWTASTKYYKKVSGDASIGDVVKPSTYNGFWYYATEGSTTEAVDWDTSIAFGNTGGIKDPYTLVSFTPGAVEEVVYTRNFVYGTSGTVEPAWPTSLGAVINDGSVDWTAMYAGEVQGTVSGFSGKSVFRDSSRPEPAHFFQYGTIRWVTGSNAGYTMEVQDFDDFKFYLLAPMPGKIDFGDTFTAIRGCSKQRDKCKGNLFGGNFGFDNIHNMAAFPDMPTEDRALQTPNFTTSGEPKKDDGDKW